MNKHENKEYIEILARDQIRKLCEGKLTAEQEDLIHEKEFYEVEQ